jgi:hypothetical protein
MDFPRDIVQDIFRRESMDERTRLFLCVLASVGFFGVLGGLFGAITGAIAWRGGRPAGTGLGLAVARAFTRLADEPMSPGRCGALVGATDGILFGALLGTVFGLLAGWRGSAEWQTLRPIVLAAILLAAGALLFGGTAFALAAGGRRSVLGLFVVGILGALTGFMLAGADGLIAGAVAGALAGTAAGLLRR